MAMIIAKMTPLDRILPNPWQPRESEDAEHIKSLALDIAAHGLLQKPVGRIVNDAGLPVGEWNGSFDGRWNVQLAFGHSRLAAYKWLRDVQDNSNIPGDWAYMPVIIQELTDVQMCEMAISENLQRRDLSPIEVAKAMARYRSEFGKTSAEIGALFGLSDSAVRNKMRLVELPEAAQDALESGQLTENAARRLLTLKESLPDKAISEIAVELAGQHFDRPEQADAFITDKITKDSRSKRLFYSYSSGEKTTAGDGLWPLDWQAPAERELPDARTVGQMMRDPDLAKELKANIVAGLSLLKQGRPVTGLDPDVMEALDHLVKLPACTACKFFLKVNGSGFCGRKACWEYKQSLWAQAELRRMSAELNVPIYDPAVDGEVFEQVSGYGPRREKHMRDFADKLGIFRLRVVEKMGSWWGRMPITNHIFIQMVSVSDESCAYVRQATNEKDRRDAAEKSDSAIRERNWEMQKRSRKFMTDVAAPEFGAFMFTLKPGILAVLFRVWVRIRLPDDLDGNQKTNVMRAGLGYEVVNQMVHSEIEFQGPVAVAEYLQGVAAEIGLFLPENWLDLAREIENVSVETEKA